MKLILIFYIIGCILAYGRLMGACYSLEEQYIKDAPPESNDPFLLFSFVSWFAFAGGIHVYLTDHDDKYFFKWSMRKLWKQYYLHNPKEKKSCG